MRRTRNAIFTAALAVIVLGAIAVPGFAAPEKQFTIAAPTSVSPTATTIAITVYNTTPNGNSNISSFSLTGTGVDFDITNISPGTGSGFGDNSINVNSISPIKPGRSTTFTLTVTLPDLGCSGGAINWSARAFTGNALGGDEFNFKSGDETTLDQLTTQISGSCTTISVSKYEDENVSGTKQTSEGAPTTEEFDFQLKQGATVLQTATTSGGAASFAPVASGSYSVCEVAESGWTNTDPSDGTGCKPVTATGAPVTVTFGNAADATITVTKYEDPNFDGIVDEGEDTLSGWAFQLKNANGDAIGTEQTTDANGQIVYTVTPGRAYTVCETDDRANPDAEGYGDSVVAWINTSPGGDRCVDVAAADLGSGAATGISFSNALGTLGCDPENSTDTATGGTEGQETTVDLTRGLNADGSPCILIPYSLTADTDTVTFIKDISTQPEATFRLDIVWGTPPGNYGDFKVSTFDPDGIEGNSDDYVPDNCDIVNGEAVPPATSATEHWCFAGLTIEVVGTSYQATETYLGSGDPTIRYK